MEKILEKFGGYLIDKNKVTLNSCVDYIFRFKNGYGALLIIEQFATGRLYDVAAIKFTDVDGFDFVNLIPERYSKSIMGRTADEVCEYLQRFKDLK